MPIMTPPHLWALAATLRVYNCPVAIMRTTYDDAVIAVAHFVTALGQGIAQLPDSRNSNYVLLRIIIDVRSQPGNSRYEFFPALLC